MKLELKNLTKKFDDQIAVDDLTVDINSGELIALLGPSGCGKSTILNMISGIIPVTDGKILFDGEDVTDLPSHERGIGLVFQNYALYPNMTVLENICFPLEIKKVPKAEREQKAKEIAKLVYVDEYLNRMPSQLSGGQQQRVAIARALIKKPKVLLLDEPLSNLDARLRIEMREEIRRIQQETKVTTVFVTHDQEDAMSIADQIIVMNRGVLQQMDHPQVLYDNPYNCFVADFMGNPKINKMEPSISDNKLVLTDGTILKYTFDDKYNDQDVYLSFRAENVIINDDEGIPAYIERVSVLGKERIIYISVANQIIRVIDNGETKVKSLDCFIKFKNENFFVFIKDTGERIYEKKN